MLDKGEKRRLREDPGLGQGRLPYEAGRVFEAARFGQDESKERLSDICRIGGSDRLEGAGKLFTMAPFARRGAGDFEKTQMAIRHQA
jgi:hypothetical protein